MLRVFSILLLVTMLALAAAPVAGAAQPAGPVTATISAPGGPFTVGDQVRLTLAVTHPAGYQVIMPQLAGAWGDFTVVSQSPATITDNGDGTETTRVTIDARLFQPGTFNTPPLEVTVTDGQGNLVKAAAASAAVAIASVLQEGDAELRDIKPPVELSSLAPWLWILAGVAAALAVASLIVMSRRRPAHVAVDNRLPHERALDDLAAIEAMQLPERGMFKEHYTLVSGIVRTYVERRFNIPALERTTREIRADLRGVDAPPEIKTLFITVLNESDLIKFSTIVPDVESANQLLAQGRTIVEATKPVEEPGGLPQADRQPAPAQPPQAQELPG